MNELSRYGFFFCHLVGGLLSFRHAQWMSYRNVGEFHSDAGRKLKNSPFSRFWKENTPFRDGKSKEELLRNAWQFQQRKTSINGEEIVLRFVVLSTRRWAGGSQCSSSCKNTTHKKLQVWLRICAEILLHKLFLPQAQHRGKLIGKIRDKKKIKRARLN